MHIQPQFDVALTSAFSFPDSPINNVAKNGLAELREDNPKVWGLPGSLTTVITQAY